MKKTALVIMAAGLGSRFGGIKQLEPVGVSGEIIMDYSIYDAIKAGFDKIIFIIRRDLEKDFKEVIGNRIAEKIEVEYAYQEMADLPEGFRVPEGRTKPWGTGQAVLSCKDIIREPFAVINADDYYGREAFEKVHDYLVQTEEKSSAYCMAGFVLGNTLSENGTVTRGVCHVDEEGFLVDIKETRSIGKKGGGAVAREDSGEEILLDLNSPVSMNMWGFTPELLPRLQDGFVEFLKAEGQELKSEYLLPEEVGRLIQKGQATVKVLSTEDKWFGVTYKEDKQIVMDSIRELVEKGIYPERLF